LPAAITVLSWLVIVTSRSRSPAGAVVVERHTSPLKVVTSQDNTVMAAGKAEIELPTP